MSKTIIGADAFNDEVSVPVTGDPIVSTDVETVAQRAVNNDVWVVSRLATTYTVVSLDVTNVDDPGSGWATIDSTASTTFVSSGTFTGTVAALAGDIVLAFFSGTLESTDTSPQYAACKLYVDSGGMQQRADGGTEVPVSLSDWHAVVVDGAVDVAVEIRTSSAGVARLNGSGRLVVAVLRPFPNPL